MTVCFWYLVKSDLSDVYCTRHTLQVTFYKVPETLSCLTGHPVQPRKEVASGSSV